MAPEQARDSRAASVQSDIYSLGCTFYHMLAAVPPFHTGSLPERIYQHLGAEPPDVRDFNPRCPRTWSRCCSGCSPRSRRIATRRRPSCSMTCGRSASRKLDATATHTPSTDLPEEPAPPPAPASEAPAEPIGPVAVAKGDGRVTTGQFGVGGGQLLRGNRVYAIELLLACCRLRPGQLRLPPRPAHGPERPARAEAGGWLERVRGFASWVKLRLARRFGNHLQVLVRGAEVLTRNPLDLETQTDMAAAATALGLGEMTRWLLEQAHEQDKSSPAVNRALARYHEGRKDFEQAIASWEAVARAVPGDREAAAQLRDLAALQTVEQNRTRQKAERGDGRGPRRPPHQFVSGRYFAGANVFASTFKSAETPRTVP